MFRERFGGSRANSEASPVVLPESDEEVVEQIMRRVRPHRAFVRSLPGPHPTHSTRRAIWAIVYFLCTIGVPMLAIGVIVLAFREELTSDGYAIWHMLAWPGLALIALITPLFLWDWLSAPNLRRKLRKHPEAARTVLHELIMMNRRMGIRWQVSIHEAHKYLRNALNSAA